LKYTTNSTPESKIGLFMVSSHSKQQILQRVFTYWEVQQIWQEEHSFVQTAQLINTFLDNEYETIPPQERIGKGRFFISKIAANGCINILKGLNRTKKEKIYLDTLSLLDYGEVHDLPSLIYFAITLIAEFTQIDQKFHQKALEQAKIWADHEKWEIRESVEYIIRLALASKREYTLTTLKEWISSSSPNIRRIVVESLRPFANLKWLRDPAKNDEVFSILYHLRKDASSYVRTSVGNNLKDLSKYMPEIVLQTSNSWINEAKINVTQDLASKGVKELGRDNYNLIWTIKHGLRWLKRHHPEYRSHIGSILGENYVNFFDEKRNRLAKPK